ncbi:MAG TPA: hypothetical protein VE621_10805 [Bryobacteraceae bacterium]|nr:hypothetical protein [Bryobacteraceae bacterium]
MQRKGLSLAAWFIAALLTAPTGTSQSRPDFSGTWELDADDKAATETQPHFTLVIAQNSDEIRVETRNRRENSSEVLVYKLDGSEYTVHVPPGGPITTKCYWDGSKLVMETRRPVRGVAVKTLHTFALNSTGEELLVDKTLMVQHGYRSLNPRNTGTGKEVYIRAKSSLK